MAQLVEQRIRNAQVVGSSPTISSRKSRPKDLLFSYTIQIKGSVISPSLVLSVAALTGFNSFKVFFDFL